MADIENFLEERARLREELELQNELVMTYMSNTPQVQPRWDTSPQSVSFNDIDDSIVEQGVDIYCAPFEHVWNGIYEPGIYDKNTLWEDVHDPRKIAKIIDAWKHGTALSPMFLVKHGSRAMALVADGKHRLTVARYMGSESIPFMVSSYSSDWLQTAIPSAKRI